MSKVYRPTSNVSELPDDVVLRVSGVSKKFCRNLRRSMWYGIQDLSKNLMGMRDAGFGMRDTGYGIRDSGGSRISNLESSPSDLGSRISDRADDGLRPAEFWALRDISFDLSCGEHRA